MDTLIVCIFLVCSMWISCPLCIYSFQMNKAYVIHPKKNQAFLNIFPKDLKAYVPVNASDIQDKGTSATILKEMNQTRIIIYQKYL
ncbi:hypothetical protein PRUPE_3G028300 [Prunus persica]|uniref:Uncharacterized protein n=1 Tax=Prunus persica TaxID=3760 RepID=A0A251PUB9_PRUPE|nr:hypothetical protein PRUPE_3G028300 [Prunus persica]